MKKSCKNCKALTSIGSFNFWCSLHYKIESKEIGPKGWLLREYYPLEKCPKPTTYAKFIELSNEKSKEWNAI